GVGVRRSGCRKSRIIRELRAESEFRKRGVIVRTIMLEDHVRQLQAAAVLYGRALRFALRIEPLGIGVAVILTPVGAGTWVHIKNGINDAADIPRHPERTQRR